jgi:hypothetical protein
MIVHHQPPPTSDTIWNLHAWQLSWDGNAVWDPKGVVTGTAVDFQFPAVPDPRNLQFKYRATSASSGQSSWEPDDFIRRVVQSTSTGSRILPASRVTAAMF